MVWCIRGQNSSLAFVPSGLPGSGALLGLLRIIEEAILRPGYSMCPAAHPISFDVLTWVGRLFGVRVVLLLVITELTP